MKVVHIESGLGNQMLSYCEYLALKKVQPDDEYYLETIIYDIPQCNDVICQWNGYELERIFGISEPENIKTKISSSDWNKLMEEIIESKFWAKNMNYPVHFCRAFHNIGIELENTFGDFEDPRVIRYYHPDKSSIKEMLRHTIVYQHLRRIKESKLLKYNRHDDSHNKLFYSSTKSQLVGQKLLLKYRGYGLDLIDEEVRKAFVFPEIPDAETKRASEFIQSCNSVAIHARRGDMLGSNGYLYRTGYFQKAVKYIKRHVINPIFFVFCDPGSVDWAKANSSILGLDFNNDKIYFVDWNKGLDSYKDMQLMSQCKHQIMTHSTFGWWGAWLNNNPDKITIAPDYRIISTTTI